MPTKNQRSNTPSPSGRTDVKNAQIPDHPVSGKIHELDFVSQKTSLTKGDIKLSPANGIDLVIHGLGTNFREPSSYELQPASGGDNSQIKIRTMDQKAAGPKTETIVSGYSMKLKFGSAVKRKVHGQLYLCLPDDSQKLRRRNLHGHATEEETVADGCRGLLVSLRCGPITQAPNTQAPKSKAVPIEACQGDPKLL